MSKQFRGKPCVYCAGANIAETGDHVFAREFFLPSQRANLPKVPACNQCNRDKADLEHYLTALLPFGGRQADASNNLATMVPKRLARNRRLHGQLARGIERIWTREVTGLYLQAVVLPFDGERLEEWLAFIVKGLLWHHWKVLVAGSSFVDVFCLTPRGESFFSRYFGMNAAERIENDFGDGTFVYEGAQGLDNPQVSVWRFSLFGGLKLAGDGVFEQSARFGALTGPLRVKEIAERRPRRAGFRLS